MKIYVLLSLFAAILVPQHSLCDAKPIIETGYSSELEAVKAATDFYNPLSISQDREYMGAILRTDSGFGFTVVAGEKSADSVALRVDSETWAQTVALWHTHGGPRSGHRYFSDRDTKTVTQFRLPFYLADYTGYLKVYRAGDPTLSPFAARRLGLNFRAGYAIGSYVVDGIDRPIRIRTRARDQQSHAIWSEYPRKS